MHRVAKKKVLTIYTLYTFLIDKNFDICFTKDLIVSTQLISRVNFLIRMFEKSEHYFSG